MKCVVDGCYAKPLRRRMCANHYRLWMQQLSTAPGPTEREALRATPAPPSYVCRCAAPIVMTTGMFPGAIQCQRCGRPPIESLSRKEPT